MPAPMVAIIQDIHSFKKYTLSAWRVPGTLEVLGYSDEQDRQGPSCIELTLQHDLLTTGLLALSLIFMSAHEPLDLMVLVLIFSLL